MFWSVMWILATIVFPIIFLTIMLRLKTGFEKYKLYARYTRQRWESWYAWFPVIDVHGTWHWGETVYRSIGNTYVDHDDWTWYYYGTLLDVIASNEY